MVAGTRYGLEVRSAQPADAAAVAGLLGHLGVRVEAREAAERIELLAREPGCQVLVAADWGPAIALVAVQRLFVPQRARPVARVTALVVDPEERRRGIGRLLLKAASQAARVAGCDAIELAVPPGRAEAAAFCRSTGFAEEAALFVRPLRKRGGD